MHFLAFTIGILCITGCISAASENTEGCSQGLIYAHATDCSKYLVCNHGTVREMPCPSGLLFDPQHLICNYAEHVNCNKKPEEKVTKAPGPETKPDPVETPDHKNCLSARGQFPHPKDCKKYYDCWDETAIIRQCPNGLKYDYKLKQCVPPEVASCYKGIDNEIPDENKDEILDENKDEKPDKKFCLSSRGQFPHPTDCRKYYNCWDENVILSSCPVGTVFEPIQRACLSSESTKCQVRRLNYKVSNGRQKVALFLSLQQTVKDLDDFNDDKYIKGVRIPGYKCPMARGQFAHEKACRMFYDCWDEIVLLRKCPTGLLFDPVVRICDFPERVNCQGKFVPGKTDEVKAPEIKCDFDEGLLPHFEDCRKFYICHQGIGKEFICPENLLFDVHSMACEWPGEAKCADATSRITGKPNRVTNPPVVVTTAKSDVTKRPVLVTTPKIDPSKVGSECKGKVDGVYESTDCGSFIKCVAGRTYHYKCAARNLAFDPRTMKCEHRENVPKCH